MNRVRIFDGAGSNGSGNGHGRNNGNGHSRGNNNGHKQEIDMTGKRIAANGSIVFAPGAKPGPGNPYAAKISELRAALFQEVTRADICRVTRQIIELAASGDVKAAKLLLDRALGKVPLEMYLQPIQERSENDLVYL